MPVMPATFRSKNVHKQNGEREYEARRRKNKPWRKWYDWGSWKRARAECLKNNPVCVRCLQDGRYTIADTVNHIRPHRGNWSLFIDPENHESVCKQCHDTIIQREEWASR